MNATSGDSTGGDAGWADAEWLEADGRGGFAMGPVAGSRTRRYHALLLTAAAPPTGRMVLVNGVEAWVDSPAGRFPLGTQGYVPDVLYPDAAPYLAGFTRQPWPTWTFHGPDGLTVTQEVFTAPSTGDTVLRWRASGPAVLRVRPLLSGRDYHSLHHENPAFRFDPVLQAGSAVWRPYDSVPPIGVLTNGAYRHDPTWHRGFLYAAERDRGLDYVEDLAVPGEFTWTLGAGTLGAGDAVMVLRASVEEVPDLLAHADALAAAERTRRAAVGPLTGAATAYLVGRGAGLSVIAGYPWFSDWGRDTFIALRGLLIATGRPELAERVLLEWSGLVSEGMVPNRFPDDGTAPEYNTADASLWFVTAVHDLLAALGAAAAPATVARLRAAVLAILDGHAAGTRYGIAMDRDGLLRAGAPGQQLTWMDAKVDGWVVTPRIGKPVEIQALWINALQIGARWNPRWTPVAAQARATFLRRFPNPAGGLHDVVDVDGVAGTVDSAVRPNQVFAAGGLPYAVLEPAAARPMLAVVEARLLTPLGLRTLSPDDPAYRPHYAGGRLERDGAYHQGTVWPWLIGPYVDAWLRAHRSTPATRARMRLLLAPLLAHLEAAGLGHVSEVADGDAPHRPGGCPFQAWSLGELIRALGLTAPE